MCDQIAPADDVRILGGDGFEFINLGPVCLIGRDAGVFGMHARVQSDAVDFGGGDIDGVMLLEPRALLRQAM